LALNNPVSLLGSYSQFLWTPLLSPTFSLLTGQWLDFHHTMPVASHRTTTITPPVLLNRFRSALLNTDVGSNASSSRVLNIFILAMHQTHQMKNVLELFIL
jgi:hypothetical protein